VLHNIGARLDQHLAHCESPPAACCAYGLDRENAIDGRLTASQIAAASAGSFWLRRT